MTHSCPVCAAMAARSTLTASLEAEIGFLRTCLELRDGDVAALREELERLKDVIAGVVEAPAQ